MKSVFSITSTILVVFILASCISRSQVQSELVLGVEIPSDKINTIVKLLNTPAMANSLRINDDITFQLINFSEKTVVFPDNFGVKVYENNAGKWSEVQNKAYNAGGVFSLRPRNLVPAGLPVTVWPYLVGVSSPVKIRVVVVGHVENMDVEPVVAYIDVVLNP